MSVQGTALRHSTNADRIIRNRLRAATAYVLYYTYKLDVYADVLYWGPALAHAHALALT